VRYAYELPPILNTDPAPQVSAVTGAGGASVQTPDGTGYGSVLVYGAGASGSVALTFASAPPTLFVAGSDAFGTITQNTVGNVVTISWTGGRASESGNPRVISYEWASL